MGEAARPSAADPDRAASFDFDEEEVDEAIPAGTIIADRYRVLAILGAGGMGTVYRGEHLTVGRSVAIKVLSGEWSGQGFVARRFQAEARIASTIGHPNIVEVFDAGKLPDGRLFLVMEHLEGHDLAAELAHHHRLSQQRTAQVLRQVALALAAAHKAGVIHRDLKPGNVMIARRADDEIVKILDFGVASSPRATARDGQRLTIPGSVMGTPDYMAPEQATAEPTPRFDIYALGVMAFEMLTGEPPIDADDAFELLVRKRQEAAPSLAVGAPWVHPEFIRLIDDCLQILPSRRPLDASEFLERLDIFIDELSADERASPSPASAATIATHDLAVDDDPEFFVAARPLPGPATVPARSIAAPSAHTTRSRLALGLGVLGLGLVAWLSLSLSDRSAQPLIVEAAAARTDAAPPRPPGLETAPSAPTTAIPTTPPAPPDATPPTTLPSPPLAAPSQPAAAALARGPGAPKPAASKREFASSECTRLRTRADEARRSQSWGLLRDLSRRRSCWATDAEARKLQTKALMELGDFTGCLSAGTGLTDKEVVQWRKLCKQRGG
jgi:serine/threonine-protein kinase